MNTYWLVDKIGGVGGNGTPSPSGASPAQAGDQGHPQGGTDPPDVVPEFINLLLGSLDSDESDLGEDP